MDLRIVSSICDGLVDWEFLSGDYTSLKYLRTNRIAIAPSPTAEEIPVIAVNRTSPEAKIPGTLV